MSIEIEADEIKRVTFSLAGPSHMVIEVVMLEHRCEQAVNDFIDQFGDSWVLKILQRNFYKEEWEEFIKNNPKKNYSSTTTKPSGESE